jgi:hypothetical protein
VTPTATDEEPMSTTAAPPAPTSADEEVKKAQERLDALDYERRVAIPAREREIHLEQAEARRLGDGVTVQRLQEEKYALARRNNAIIQREQSVATQALREARRRQLDELMQLPTGTRDELEAGLEEAYAHQQRLQREQEDIESKLQLAMNGGDTKDAPKLMVRKSVLPFELAAAAVRVRRAEAGLLQQVAAEAEAETPALVEAAKVAQQAVRQAEEERNRAVGALRRHQDEQREAQAALKDIRRLFAEQFAKSGRI